MKKLTQLNNLVVVKHNHIIDAQYAMTVFEQRILLTCIARIDSTKSMDDNRVFTVSVNDIIDLVGISRNSAYAQLKSACKTLSSNKVIIELPNGSIDINWMSMVRYIDDQGKVELRFTQEMMPFLTQINRDFTKYDLENVLKFKSAYSIRLYELICRWGNAQHTVELSWLRDTFLLVNKYPKMKDFKKNVLDVAVTEISTSSNITVTYEQIKQGRNIVALRFIYSRKQGNNKTNKTLPLVDMSDSPSLVLQPTTDSKIVIDIPQLNAKEKVIAQNALAKVPEDTQQTILTLLKDAIAKGNVKSPIRYLNGLVSKALSGDLDFPEPTTDVPTINDFTKKSLREEKIRKIFAKNSEKMKAVLDADGFVIIKGEGTVTKSEFEALGLIEKAPRTGAKSISLAELMAQAEEKEKLRKEQQELLQKNPQKTPQSMADIPPVPMSEKEIAERQKILELEAQLIAAGEFVGINKNAIADDEIAKLVDMEATLKSFKKMSSKGVKS